MKVIERCACGGSIEADGDDTARAVLTWREDHTCDRRVPAAHEQADAHVEQAEPAPVGFAVQP